MKAFAREQQSHVSDLTRNVNERVARVLRLVGEDVREGIEDLVNVVEKCAINEGVNQACFLELYSVAKQVVPTMKKAVDKALGGGGSEAQREAQLEKLKSEFEKMKKRALQKIREFPQENAAE